MERTTTLCLLLTVCVCFLLQTSRLCTCCIEEERRALLAFKHTIYNDTCNLVSDWKGEDCCRWAGVGCSNTTTTTTGRHVLKLSIQYIESCDTYSSHLDPSLSNLKHLQHLDLSGISFNMTAHIPNFIGSSLTSLEYLDLFETGGSIPSNFRNLTSLKHLDLSTSYLHSDNLEWLSHLSSLQYLDMSGTNLSECFLPNLSRDLIYLRLSSCSMHGLIPESVRRLSKLEVLDLSDNILSGSIPDWIGQLKNIQALELQDNSLNGSVPESLEQLSELVLLFLAFNSLQGVVSDTLFAKMSKLEELALSGNRLIFDMSSAWDPPFQLDTIALASTSLGPRFPSWLQKQKALSYLDISNTGIVDVIPDWFWNISSGIDYLNVSANKIRGEVPTSLQHLSASTIDLSSNHFRGNLPYLNSNLKFLYLQDNQFTGILQPILNKEMNNLEIVLLSRNNLNGGIPYGICYLNAGILDLSHNALSKEIPNCHTNSSGSLFILNLANNCLVGTIPQWIGASQPLQELHLDDNRIQGEIPQSLRNCTQLEILDLGVNKLTGTIPSWIGESLSSLMFLRLCSNKLSGTIPPQLSHLSHLQVLDLSQNSLSGMIPQSLKNFTAMTKSKRLGAIVNYVANYTGDAFLKYADASLSEEVLNEVMKGREFQYNNILSLLMILDLSCNKLSGEIPVELTDLVGLESLNLSGNHLTGKIPNNFGGMELESLDLSRNKLSGAIPSSIALLTSLSFLNLSYNNLSGRIPLGPQLQTFTNASIYEGNPGLCGPPLKEPCPEDKPGSQKHDETGNDGSDTFDLYLSMGLGYAVGLWGVLGTLIFMYSWRIAYFQFVDDMTNRFYVAKAILRRRILSRLLG